MLEQRGVCDVTVFGVPVRVTSRRPTRRQPGIAATPRQFGPIQTQFGADFHRVTSLDQPEDAAIHSGLSTDKEQEKPLAFITNNFSLRAMTAVSFYHGRSGVLNCSSSGSVSI